MALSQRLELRQGQSLVLTPQLQQAIKMLQLSSLDLAAYVETELERNPLLERDDSDDDGPAAEDRGSAADAADGTDGGDTSDGGDEPEWLAESLGAAVETTSDQIDAEPEAIYPDAAPADIDPGLRRDRIAETSGGTAAGGEAPDIEAYLTRDPTLADHVFEQLALCRLTPAEQLIARALCDLLDDAGYLAGDTSEMAARLGATEAAVESVLCRLQGFEPAGIFARSLAECLTLQLKDRNRHDPAMAALVDNLDLLGRRDLAALRRLCGVDDADLADMIAEIRQLNPKPGMAFGGAPVQTVVPDIFVAARPDGSWAVTLNPDTLPKVLVNQTYYATVARTARAETDKAYLTDCLQNANWLVKSLEQRARTVLKVATEIVRQQDGFLLHGVTHLRPLNLRTVADAIGMHESTVSRVTSNKYMATSRGIYELKYFFTSAIAATGQGEAVSAEAVRFRIREMIEAEPPARVLSDDTIVQRLRDAGIDIARRTVAKYRESMRIPSSVQRRREKQSLVG